MSEPDTAPSKARPPSHSFREKSRKLIKTIRKNPSPDISKDLYNSIEPISYGTITFGDNKSNQAQFIRINQDTSPLGVRELLDNHWCKERPSLVISITGGATDFKMKSRLSRVFRRGLIKVARTTGAWIITGGTNKGIMKIVGDLIQVNRDPVNPIHLIGIATWGCISNRTKLNVRGSNVHYSKPSIEKDREAPLEPNHTKFIFVDDGSENAYGREIQFRARLEKAILGDFFTARISLIANSEHTKLTARPSNSYESSNAVPVVLLVVEGGPNTVETVHQSVFMNNIPAVFLEGTGRCCDLFGKAVRLYSDYRSQNESIRESSRPNPDTPHFQTLKTRLRAELDAELRAVYSTSKPVSSCVNIASRQKIPQIEDSQETIDKLNKMFDMVYECVHHRFNLLNVVSLNSSSGVEPDIDLAILHALLNATSDSTSSKVNYARKREQFLLALQWNRDDIARKYIMKTICDWEKVNLKDVYQLALEQNKIGFVELLLDHGLSLTDAFQGDKLPKMYQKTLEDREIFPESNMNASEAEQNPSYSWEDIYRIIFQSFLGDFFDVKVAVGLKHACIASLESELIDEEPCACCISTRASRKKCLETQRELERLSPPVEGRRSFSEDQIDVDKELFLWSVVTGKHDLARLFWGRSKNKICAALIAVVVGKKLAKITNNSAYSRIAHDFEDLAVRILDRYYRTNPRDCRTGITRQIPIYGNVTWLQLAIKGSVKPFVAHPSVQKVLDEIWYGDIHQPVCQWMIIFVTFIPALSNLLEYRDKQTKINEQPGSNSKSSGKISTWELNTWANSKHDVNKDKDRDSGAEMPLIGVTASNTDVPADSKDSTRIAKIRTSIRLYFQNLLKFIRAPYVKYLYNIYYHLLFLMLFSYVMLCDFFPLYPVDVDVCPFLSTPDQEHPSSTAKNTTNLNNEVFNSFEKRDRISIAEWLLFFWVFTLLSEEVRQFLSMESRTLQNRFTAYFKIFWNQLDIFAIALFYVGFTLRFFPATECFCAARILLSVDLTLWFIRSLDMFEVVKQLGPKLVMIGEMVKDFKFFVLLLTVFILGFGVSIYSILFGSKVFSWHLPRKIFNLAYWQMFGELNALDTFEYNYTPNGYAAFILLIAYMLVVSILLVNLLIAMFSYKFDQLQNDTDRIWKFQRYSLVYEFLARPTLPPPFTIISHFWRLVLYGVASLTKSSWVQAAYKRHSSRTTYRKVLDEKAANIIETAEDAEGDEVYESFMKTSSRGEQHDYNLDEARLQSPQEIVLTKVQSLECQMQAMKNQQNQMMEYLTCLMDGLKTMGGNRVRIPERHYFISQDSIDDINYDEEQLRQSHRKNSLPQDSQKVAAADSNACQAQTNLSSETGQN